MPSQSQAADTFDYVIVGAGASGSIVAARLVEKTNATVCLIEAGPSDRRPYVMIPAGFTKTLSQDDITWQFKTEPTANTGGRPIATTQGKVVGGSGSINGMIYVRGQPADYDHWAQLGNRGWGYDDVLPYFQRSERRIGGDPADGIHGRDGGVPVSDMDWFHPISEAFIDVAHKRGGLPRNPDYNSGEQEGVGYFQRTIGNGLRISSAQGILRPAMKTGRIQLLTKARATRILTEGRRATGVAFVRSRGGAERTVRARREVIVCAGPVNTPRLLQVSGIGPGGLLRDIGVAPVHHLAGVGENLIDHYSARLVMKAKPGLVTLNELARAPRLWGQVTRWLLRQPNILALVPSQVYMFPKSRPELDFPDLQCVFTPGSYQEGKHYMLDSYPGVTGGAWQHRPLSRGHVRATAADVFVDPLIQPNYLDHPVDQDVMVAGMQFVRHLLHAPELKEYLVSESIPGAAVQTDEDMLDFCRNHGSTGYHLVGTARMGREDDPLAVVDDQLRVHGMEGLRVTDSSVMPNIVSANTYAATMMIAERAADLIHRDLAN